MTDELLCSFILYAMERKLAITKFGSLIDSILIDGGVIHFIFIAGVFRR